ncbi:MAG: GTP-binding protein [Methylobacterium mesophilicum]|nr:GTP-binding protein [Methylobacterium mesophilicum]
MSSIPVSVLTGFLGSGKTTLLNRLLRDPAMSGAAVIINEWGEVSIDHLLVEKSTEGIVQLSGGCLCCTVRGDLADTLADLAARAANGEIGPLSRVVVETTGLADPVPVLQLLIAHPFLSEAFRLDGVITLVDALHGLETLDTHEEARAQVGVADRLLISKKDLAAPEQVATLAAALRDLNPRSPLSDAAQADAAILSAGLIDPATRKPDIARWLGAHRHDHDHHDHDHHSHEHHHHHGIGSFVLTHDGPLPYASIDAFLDLVRSQHGPHLLRLKGIVELSEAPAHPLVVHGVRDTLHPPTSLKAWPDDTRGARLVLIGRHLDEAPIRALWNAVSGRAELDRPDRAALLDNPLAIPGMAAR